MAGMSRRSVSKLFSPVFVFLLLLSTIKPAVSQLPTATILGNVKDSSGAVVPGATVIARNVDTGQTRTASSAADGSYRIPALPVGNYELRVENPGFQTEVRQGLTLSISQEAVVNIALQVGAVEQTVAVTAEAPIVNTTSGSLGGLVDEQKIAELPLNGRNFIDLTMAQTGVVQHTRLSTSASSTVGTWFSSNGAPLRSNNYLLDGAVMQSVMGATPGSASGSTLGVEGIREYRVVTNSFTAEYGMTMGSQMVIVSKGGTNNFHGSLFEYLRNDHLDARNFFDYKTVASQRRLPPFKKNNFGGSVGGPVRKDKDFFHVVYEGVRERLGVTRVLNVIPASAKVDGGAGGVPQIAAVVKPLLTLFPNPNLPGNQFTYPVSQPTNEVYSQARADHNFSVGDSLFARYTIDDAEQVKPQQYPQFNDDRLSRSQYATLSENHVFSPAVLNTARFSYSRTKTWNDSISGISGPQFSFVPGREIGTITVSGLTGMGPQNNNPTHFKQNVFTWSDDLFYTRGAHSLKFGALSNHYQQFIQVSTNINGTINFPSLVSFLSGGPLNTYTSLTPGSILARYFHYTTLGFYVQDDWRVKSNLMLNLGLRYEFNTQPNEVTGHGAALRDVQHDANTTLGPPFENSSLKNFSPRFGFAWDVNGNGKTAVRGGFGLLYDIGNMGSGLVVGTTATPPFSSSSEVLRSATFSIPFSFPPGAAGKALRTVDYLLQQPHLLQYNLTVERQLPFATGVTLAYAGSRGINLVQTKEGNPTVPQGVPVGNTCVAQNPPPAFSLTQPRCWTGTDPRTNPNWTTMEFKTGGGSSWYHSLQFGASKRLSKGLQFQSSYTWSKLLDETQGQLGAENGGTPVDSVHRKLDHGPAEFDITQSWRFNAIYRLPALVNSGGATGAILNGWWISGIISAQTGYAFSPTLGSDRSRQNAGTSTDRPDWAPGATTQGVTSGKSRGCQVGTAGVPAGTPLGTPQLYFDPCAFAIHPLGFVGNVGRNVLRGPGVANLDFSVAKDTALRFLGESGKLEFRAEIFNILNHANFDMPSTASFSALRDVEAPLANAGRITSTGGRTSRQIQFALKILF